jgi:hypothetical protein
VLSTSSPDPDGTSSRTASSSAEDLNSTPPDQHSDHERELEALKAESVHVEEVQNSPKANATPVANRSRAHTTSKYGPGTPGSAPPLELLLYREAIECPICFLYYPKYVNYTRCCSQPICSECFLQIKRSEPHPPSSSPGGQTASTSSSTTSTGTPINASTTSSTSSSSPTSSTAQPELPTLVSDPAFCPFCTEQDFGVYFIPGPFRSGIGRSIRVHSAPRRRGSLPPTAPEVVTTDRIRPDWALKLSAARQHLARKSAAANALHATAFLLDGTGDPSSRSRKKERKKKPSRLRALQSSLSSSGSSTPTERSILSRSGRNRGSGLEELMIVEAIRLSLYDQNGTPNDSPGSSKRASELTTEGGVRTVI